MEDIGHTLEKGTCRHCGGAIELIEWGHQGTNWLHTDPAENGWGMQGAHCPGQYRAEPVITVVEQEEPL
jgi:hypothetical protein